MIMRFGAPEMLYLLLVFPPALFAFFWWSDRTRQRMLTQFVQSRLLAGLLSGVSPARQKVKLACLISAVVFLILALARPQWGFDWEPTKVRGLDIVVAIDTSKSMLAADIAPNRLARAKLAALDLMQQAKADRLGLVAFAGKAFLQCPLTIDDAAFRQSVESLDVKTIPQGGTAIAEAIDTTLGSFKEGDNHKVMVLFTDGEDHDSGALEAAQRAGEAGLRIYTVGVGTAEGELLRIKDEKGSEDYVRDEQGNVVKSHLNEDLLRQIAGATGGFYLPLRGAKTIDNLYEQGPAKLPKSEHQEKLVRQYHERYQWPLAAAVVLLLVEIFFPERKRDAETRQPTPLRKPSRVPQTVALLFLVVWPMALFGSTSSALREYEAGKYDQAFKQYKELLEKKKSADPRLHFNAGAAAYREGQFEEATKQFNESLNSPDVKVQEKSYYNRGNALFRLGEGNPDPSKRTEIWKKSLQDYDSTLKLNPQEADAKFNLEYVKRKLEELKQQQQQSQKDKSDKNQDQNKDQQQNQDQQQKQDQQKDQSKQDQNSQQQSQQNQPQQKQDSSEKNQQQQQQAEQPEQKKEDQSQQAANQKQQQEENQKQQGQNSKAGSEGNTNEVQQAQAYPPGQMTPQEAQQLMDAQKGDEQMLQLKPAGKPPEHGFKDW
jgi:Ca-activated chloride channel family protein